MVSHKGNKATQQQLMTLVILDHFHNVADIALQSDTDLFNNLGIDIFIFSELGNRSCTDASSLLEIFFLHVFID